MARITKRVVDGLRPVEKDIWIWDEEVHGFGVRVKPSGRKSYLVQYRNHYGTTKKITLGQHGVLTPNQARQEATRLLAEVRLGGDPAQERRAMRNGLTVDGLIDQYLDEHVRIHNRASTAREAERVSRKHIRPAIGANKIGDVSTADVMRLHREMASTPRQANLALAIMSKMFNLAEAWGLRSPNSNPCRHVKRYRENSRERFLTEGELLRVGEVMNLMEAEGTTSKVVLDAIRLLALTGCRSGEVLKLRWDDINFDASALQLNDSKTGTRLHTIGSLALAFIANLDRVDGTVWLFCGSDPAMSLRRERLQKVWEQIRIEAGIEDVRLHDLRHTVGTYSSQAGANAYLVRDKLGHKTIAMTARYVSRDTTPLRTLSDVVESRIAGPLLGGDRPKVVRSKAIEKG